MDMMDMSMMDMMDMSLLDRLRLFLDVNGLLRFALRRHWTASST